MSGSPWARKETDAFKVRIHGEVQESHDVDAQLLSKFLSGISSVLNEANRNLNGKYSDISVKVVGSFKQGSFEVDILAILTCSGVTAFCNIATIIGFIAPPIGEMTLIRFIKLLKGRKITEIKSIDGDNTEISVSNCESSIVVQNLVFNLYMNPTIQKEMSNVTFPLYEDGITEMEFSSDNGEPEIIKKEELGYFPPPEKENLSEKIETDYLLVTQSNLEGKGTGWRFSFGEGSPDFRADVSDKRFLERIVSGTYSFTHGTIIKAKYRKTTQRLEKLVTRWEILEVIDVFPSDEQRNQTNAKQKVLFA